MLFITGCFLIGCGFAALVVGLHLWLVDRDH